MIQQSHPEVYIELKYGSRRLLLCSDKLPPPFRTTTPNRSRTFAAGKEVSLFFILRPTRCPSPQYPFWLCFTRSRIRSASP